MKNTPYLLVESKVLPDVFIKVIQAKRLLARGQAQTMSQAAQMAGISRSAFYKYKDSVFTYENDSTSRIATLYCELVHEPGVLSSMLSRLSENGANIITINQNIPVDGVAPVSVSLRTEQLQISEGELIDRIRELYGVVTLRLLAGE